MNRGMRMLYLFAALVLTCFAIALLPCHAEAATWSKWKPAYQASCYGPWEGENITATGKRITNSSKYIAVPIKRVVSKKKWKKLSAKGKRKYFYYGEKIQLKRTYKGKTYKVVGVVQDCGGFAGYGHYVKGKWVPRIFDLTPGCYKALKFYGVADVKWRYAK